MRCKTCDGEMITKTGSRETSVRLRAGRESGTVASMATSKINPARVTSSKTSKSKKPMNTKESGSQDQSASKLIDKRIAELGDWRGKTLSRMRKLIKEADPEVVEEWKWAKASSPGTPVWSHNGMICTGESYKSTVKLTFFNGASLEDPAKLFNSSLEGNTRRAM